VLIGVGLLAYSNSFHNGFIYDDLPYIVDNPRFHRLWPPGPIVSHTSRPVVLLSLALNYAVGGLNPWGYHLFNVAVHILAALTLYGVARRTLVSESLQSRFGEAAPWLAMVISLAWLVHPLQTESVTYTIQRGESLMGLFYLLSLYSVIRSVGPSRNGWWRVGAVASCALGMACKPVMVTAPVVLLLYDRAFLAKSWRETLRQRWPLYACLAATWLLLPLLLANGASEWKPSAGFGYEKISWPSYLFTQPGAILHYLRLALWPAPLCFDYGWEYGWPAARTLGEALPTSIAVAALLAGTAWAWRQKPAIGFLGAWFFIILAPTSSFVPLADLVVEHRMYLPLAAVVAAVVVGGFELGGNLLSGQPQTRGILGGAACLALALPLTLLTIRRNRDYLSGFTIWQDTVSKRPTNPRAHNALGLILVQAGQTAEGINQYEQAVRIKPDYGQAHNNLAVALFEMDKVDDAIRHFERALAIKPDDAEAHDNFAIALFELGRVKEATAHFEQAVRIKPDLAAAHFNLGVAFEQTGRRADAIEQFERALQLKPDYAEARSRLARLRAAP